MDSEVVQALIVLPMVLVESGLRPLGSLWFNRLRSRRAARGDRVDMIVGSELGICYDPDQHAAYAASWIQILENQPLEIFRAAADGEKIHTYLQTLQQQQSVSSIQLSRSRSICD